MLKLHSTMNSRKYRSKHGIKLIKCSSSVSFSLSLSTHAFAIFGSLLFLWTLDLELPDEQHEVKRQKKFFLF